MAKRKVVKKSKKSKKRHLNHSSLKARLRSKYSKVTPLRRKSRTKSMQRKGSIKSKSKSNLRWHAVPLKSSFMLMSMLGFLISAYWVYPQSFNYGIAFMVLFAAMFVAALVSMTKAPVVTK